MDSAYTYVHWEKSNLPAMADEWIGNKLEDDTIKLSDTMATSMQTDDASVFNKPEKPTWQPHPMED
ncbi:hypothetical protein BC940DRAFT_295505 [Gongronella butleri]|nr:hypothetical protein BC940DRAFT_295505 [Gongronella butleri]